MLFTSVAISYINCYGVKRIPARDIRLSAGLIRRKRQIIGREDKGALVRLCKLLYFCLLNRIQGLKRVEVEYFLIRYMSALYSLHDDFVVC